MTFLRSLPWAFVVAMLVAASAVVPLAGAGKPESCRPGVVFQNEDVRVWFHGAKDFFKVFDQAGEEDAGGHYAYAATRIVERDASGAAVATMNLQAANPQASTCVVERGGEFVNMTLSATDRLQGAAGSATVAFTFHFNTSSHGGKFDLDVVHWPWSAGENHTLAYGFSLESDAWTAEAASDGVGFRDGNGTSHGYVSWAPNATARYGDHEEQSLVNATVAAEGGRAEVELAFTQVSPGYQELVYDPWMGSGDYAIVAGHLVGLAPLEDLLPRGALAGVRHLP